MLHEAPIFLVGAGAAGAEPSLASAADIHTFVIPYKCRVRKVAVQISTAISSSGTTVVEFDRTPKSGGVREAAFATVNIPTTATTVGTVYYAAPASAKYLYAGDLVTVQVATAATSAGKGYPSLELEFIPEEPGNNTALIASA